MQTEWEQELDDAKEYVRKLNVISINKDKEMEVDDEKDDLEVSFRFLNHFFLPKQLSNDVNYVCFDLFFIRLITNSIKNGICVKRC